MNPRQKVQSAQRTCFDNCTRRDSHGRFCFFCAVWFVWSSTRLSPNQDLKIFRCHAIAAGTTVPTSWRPSGKSWRWRANPWTYPVTIFFSPHLFLHHNFGYRNIFLEMYKTRSTNSLYTLERYKTSTWTNIPWDVFHVLCCDKITSKVTKLAKGRRQTLMSWKHVTAKFRSCVGIGTWWYLMVSVVDQSTSVSSTKYLPNQQWCTAKQRSCSKPSSKNAPVSFFFSKEIHQNFKNEPQFLSFDFFQFFPRQNWPLDKSSPSIAMAPKFWTFMPRIRLDANPWGWPGRLKLGWSYTKFKSKCS